MINFNHFFKKISKIENASIDEIIIKQVDLARNHGIYGFAINYIFDYKDKIYDNVLNIFLNNKIINFPFLLNWKNENFKFLNNLNIELSNFMKNIKKYLISIHYIKINNKPLISLENPLNRRNFYYFSI